MRQAGAHPPRTAHQPNLGRFVRGPRRYPACVNIQTRHILPPGQRLPTAPASAMHERLEAGLIDLIEQPDFPCVGAKSALAQGGLAVEAALSILAPADDLRIHDRIARWSREPDGDEGTFRSLAVVFAGPRGLDEVGFEAALWARLSALTAIDRARGFAPAPGYSDDPRDPSFALSFGGRAYFAVGLHPQASRAARRAPAPTIVFNLHDQFTALREAERYERMREVILARDAALDGEPNPMLARHGETSEARQYSGRMVGEDWVCPFAAGRRGS
jgi:FPC/CPF motif-containing protein YcgG